MNVDYLVYYSFMIHTYTLDRKIRYSFRSLLKLEFGNKWGWWESDSKSRSFKGPLKHNQYIDLWAFVSRHAPHRLYPHHLSEPEPWEWNNTRYGLETDEIIAGCRGKFSHCGHLSNRNTNSSRCFKKLNQPPLSFIVKACSTKSDVYHFVVMNINLRTANHGAQSWHQGLCTSRSETLHIGASGSSFAHFYTLCLWRDLIGRLSVTLASDWLGLIFVNCKESGHWPQQIYCCL